jgi:hypothetical protein
MGAHLNGHDENLTKSEREKEREKEREREKAR